MRLKDKVAIVTGSGSGMGREVALAFTREGAKVTVYDVSEAGAKKTVEEIKRIGGQGLATIGDVRKKDDIDRAVKSTIDNFGKLDILINCAGILRSDDLAGHTEDLWDSQIDINLKGAFLFSQRAVPEMLKQGKGKIVNFSSIAAYTGFPNAVAYCASKGGVLALTKALAIELAPKGINVNAVAPGDVRTALNEHLMRDPEYHRARVEATPYGRVGAVTDIAPAIVYLASDESDFAVGTILVLDGGLTSKG
jgi:NAD(P)-dependent dehydrogenase (short-subunit alcohol dehydrogenase family)